MNLTSVGGMLTLLGIAWLLSNKKQNIKLKPVFWGISLQFLFAVIILREDYWSFIGMIVLGLLIITYLLHSDNNTTIMHLILAACISLIIGYIVILTSQYISNFSGYLIIVWVVLGIFNSLTEKRVIFGKYISVLVIICGISFLISHQYYGQVIFNAFSNKVSAFLQLSDYGAKFLFANLSESEYFFTGSDSTWPGFGFQFAFKVLPTIIFFGGFMSVLYYLGIMQKVIESMSRFMRWTIGTSGAETLSCSANIFVGQTEAPLLIKPFLAKMTNSELLTIMVGGFATIAGGVLAGYIAFGIPAGHLIAASVMSAPAALVIGKIIFPETEHSETAGDVELPDISVGDNVVEAATNGITDGLKLAVNVGAMLIGFIALIAVVDVFLNFLDSIIDGRLFASNEYYKYAASGMSPVSGEFAGYFPGSLQTLFGSSLKYLAFLMGVPWENASDVGNLLGIKLSLNEFVAFGTLGNYINSEILSDRAIIISTYALCGFANFSSIGIQIGGISAIAPNRKSDLAKIGFKAMLGGAIASWLTATIAGILL